MYGRNLKAYQKTNVNAEISVADPYYVTKLLYQGLFERLAQAKGAIERGDLALKAKKLSTATAILENLRSTLDFSQSQSIAQSLFDLYSYMLNQITEASLQLITAPIDNAMRAFLPIKKAWDSLPVSAQQEAQSRRTKEQLNIDLNNSESIARGAIQAMTLEQLITKITEAENAIAMELEKDNLGFSQDYLEISQGYLKQLADMMPTLSDEEKATAREFAKAYGEHIKEQIKILAVEQAKVGDEYRRVKGRHAIANKYNQFKKQAQKYN